MICLNSNRINRRKKFTKAMWFRLKPSLTVKVVFAPVSPTPTPFHSKKVSTAGSGESRKEVCNKYARAERWNYTWSLVCHRLSSSGNRIKYKPQKQLSYDPKFSNYPQKLKIAIPNSIWTVVCCRTETIPKQVLRAFADVENNVLVTSEIFVSTFKSKRGWTVH